MERALDIKNAVASAQKEIKRRQRISKKTRGKTRKRKTKNKGKKRKKKVVNTTQVRQPPITLTDKEAKALLQVNITAKERRKKKPKTFAQRKADEIAKTGIADPSILREQQRISSEILGYRTQTRDPLTLRGRRGRYNQQPRGVSGINIDPQLGTIETGGFTGLVAGSKVGQQVSGARQLGRGGAWYRTDNLRRKRYSDTGTQTDTPKPPPNLPKKRTATIGTDPIPQLPIDRDVDSISLSSSGRGVGRRPTRIPRPAPRSPPVSSSSSAPSSRGGGAGGVRASPRTLLPAPQPEGEAVARPQRAPTREDDTFSFRSLLPPSRPSGRGTLKAVEEGEEDVVFFSDLPSSGTEGSAVVGEGLPLPYSFIDDDDDNFILPSPAEIEEEERFQQYDRLNRYLTDQAKAPRNSSSVRSQGSSGGSYRTSQDEFLMMNQSPSEGDSAVIVEAPTSPTQTPPPSVAGQVAGQVAGAVGSGLQAVGGVATDLATGVASGVVSQLPTAGQVGQAVGSGLAQGVGALAGAIGSGVATAVQSLTPEPEVASPPAIPFREIQRALPRAYPTASQRRAGRPSIELDEEDLRSELSSVQGEIVRLSLPKGPVFNRGVPRRLVRLVRTNDDIPNAIAEFDSEMGRDNQARPFFINLIRERARKIRLQELLKLAKRRNQ